MKISRTSALITFASLAVIASSAVVADDSGWYGGANIGRSSATIDDPRITSGLAGAGLTTTSIANRDRDTAYKIYGGYQFNPYIGLEGGYFDLGKFGFQANTLPLGTLCSGQVISDGLIGFFDVDSRSKALGDKLPSFE